MADPCVGGRLGAPFLRQSLCSDPTSPARDLLAPSRPASTGARCTDSASQFPIAPAEPGAPLPATSFPGGFRTPALSVCGCRRHRAGVRNPSQEQTPTMNDQVGLSSQYCEPRSAPCSSASSLVLFRSTVTAG